MPNKNYINGRAKEYRIIHRLEKEGWYCIRSAGSHKAIDIIAMRRSPDGIIELYCVQSKPKGGYLNPKEREEKERVENLLGITIYVE